MSSLRHGGDGSPTCELQEVGESATCPRSMDRVQRRYFALFINGDTYGG
jgi:hypothetical protein